MVKTYDMQDSKPRSTPMDASTVGPNMSPELEDARLYRSLVGSLNYLAQMSRPDLCYATHVLSRGLFMEISLN
eukprot:snap_masked-scaffold_7-processed-gene-19.52-mRNA-1 protein AED:0.54 eAED:0.62 QI:0/0/0/1/1/1/2/0/72